MAGYGYSGGVESRIPKWDSSPSTFQKYRDEVRVFRMAENLEQSYSVSARLISALTGPARRIGMQLTDEQLLPSEDADGKKLETSAARNAEGIRILLSTLESTLQPKKSTDRGLRMEEFFQGRRHYRRKGQRMQEYIVSWNEAVERLAEVDIKV